MTPAELRSIIQHMVDRTCEAHIRLGNRPVGQHPPDVRTRQGLARARNYSASTKTSTASRLRRSRLSPSSPSAHSTDGASLEPGA